MMRPWSAHIELTEGCNRYCTFCGIRSIRERAGQDLRFLSIETAGRIARGLASLAPGVRLEFAMHGEPTLNPHHLQILAGFRRVLPKAQLQLTTNGKTLLRDLPGGVARLFKAGVDLVVLDTYDTEREALRAAARLLPQAGLKVYDFFEDEDCPSPWGNHRGKVRAVVLMDDLAVRTGEKKQKRITNQAGNGLAVPTPAAPLQKMCTMPFREMAVCWNGDVVICCNDWRRQLVAGNVAGASLAELWSGRRMLAARRMLFARRRDFPPCNRCDVGSGNRCGLVDRQDPPTQEDVDIVNQT
jgi:MoaA/NifB/PqqE/SkfB family radical SAM enzyme